MKESNSNNTDTSGKVQGPLPAGGVGDNISAYNQQLPIKDKSARQRVHLLIEKKASLYEWFTFQNNMPVPV